MPMFWLNRALVIWQGHSTHSIFDDSDGYSAMGALATRSKWAVPVVMLVVLEIGWGQMNPYPGLVFNRVRQALSVMRGVDDKA